MKVVVFDLDDTLVETRSWFHEFLTVLGYPIPQTDSYHLEKHGIPEHVIQFALNEASFMLHAKPVPFIPTMLRFLRAAGYGVAFCTHRGYHHNAKQYTFDWFQNNHLRGYNDVHIIDALEYPCKLEYLDQIYEDYVLVDDHPKNLASKKGRVVVYDRPWNKERTAIRIQDLRQLPKALEYAWKSYQLS